jgi:hypothetical protein
MDFSLTTLFVVPASQTTVPTSVDTQDLTAGQVGIYTSDYAPYTGVETTPYIYIAQGRQTANRYLQGSKRSDKISVAGLVNWYKVPGVDTANVQITKINNFSVKCGEVVTLTLRAHSSYIDTLYFNGFTRSVTVQAPCCDCGADPCTDVDQAALVALLIAKLEAHAPGINADNISFTTFYTFSTEDTGTTLVITGNPLTKYGQPCDVAAFPYEYDRMWFRSFIYVGPATTADFIVADACNIVADVTIDQRASYPTGGSDEIFQMEKDYYSYQAGYLKHLYRMGGYNYNFESYVDGTSTYDTFVIKFKPYGEQYTWGDYIKEDATVILAVKAGTGSTNFGTILEDYLGTPDSIGVEVPYPVPPIEP